MKFFLIFYAILISILLLVSLAMPYPDNQELIIPGKSIGALTLGMTQTEIDKANETQLCTVTASYVDGKAVSLSTNFGGPCPVEKSGIMVGTAGLNEIYRFYGEPDSYLVDKIYDQSVAVWVKYNKIGIAFRVIVVNGTGDSVVQSIRVYLKG